MIFGVRGVDMDASFLPGSVEQMVGQAVADNRGQGEQEGANGQKDDGRAVSAHQLGLIGILGGDRIDEKGQGFVVAQKGFGNPGGGHHAGQHDHGRILGAAADGENDAAEDSGKRLGQQHVADGLQARGAQGRRGDADLPGKGFQRRLGGANQVGQHQERQGKRRYQQARGDAVRQVLMEKNRHAEAEKTHQNGGDAGQDVEEEPEDRFDARCGELGHVDAGAQTHGNGDDDGESDQGQGAHHGRENAVEHLPAQQQGIDGGGVAEKEV
ncbi:hypothetical protein DESC_720121 [Desulfosarcina cetonica]|nr:hypothetical protein DESC_720121 [Desulfosarcina cetonica]